MPISAIDGLPSEHWAEVLAILKDVITSADFEPNLVSDADDIGIIQRRIIQNLYNNEIIVCDVSAKNPNVMFELGMRLAFDKPTIIIKDDKTDYTFDTSVIEHLVYPRDLRFTKILDFKENLKKKIEGTYQKSKDDPKYSTFLKNFGQYKIAHLEEREVSSNEYILSTLNEIRTEISQLNNKNNLATESSYLAARNFRNSIIEHIIYFFKDRKIDPHDYRRYESELFAYLWGKTPVLKYISESALRRLVKEYFDEMEKISTE